MQAIQTKRTLLRAGEMSDLQAIHSYAGDYENTKFMIWGPNSEDDTKAFLEKAIDDYKAKPLANYMYFVILKESNKLIGGCSLTVDPSKYEAEAGWILHKSYWGQGLGTEIAHALLQYGFNKLDLHRIFATCDSENHGSYRIMERNCMRREGHFIKARKTKGEWRDVLLYDKIHIILIRNYYHYNIVWFI